MGRNLSIPTKKRKITFNFIETTQARNKQNKIFNAWRGKPTIT